jgi:diaminohydroxyphosphoribosylaminopyrimidine deaminase/5-amino-6-(5-phosphoribosylamino)uracil reductase
MSLDGRIADESGRSRWISSERSREIVHSLRGAVDAIVVGRGTVARDDPSLTPRPAGPRRPLRVVVDSGLRTPADARVVATAREHPTMFVCRSDADPLRRSELEARGVEVLAVQGSAAGLVDPVRAFQGLHERGVRRALLESGGTLLAACLRADLVDQASVFVAPRVLGGEGPTPFAGRGWPLADAPRLEEVRCTDVDGDVLVEGYWPHAPQRPSVSSTRGASRS